MPPNVTAIEWTGHPARRSPSRVAFLSLVVTICALLAARAGGVLLGMMAVVVLLGAVGRFWVPARYQVNVDGIRVIRGGRAKHRRWSELRRWTYRGEWIVVSPFAQPHFLDERRGLTIDRGSAPKQLERYLEEYVGERSAR